MWSNLWKIAGDERPLPGQQPPFQVPLPTAVEVYGKGGLPRIIRPEYGQRVVQVRRDRAPASVQELAESLSKLKTLEWQERQLWQDLRKATRHGPRAALLRNKQQELLRQLQLLRSNLPRLRRRAWQEALRSPDRVVEWRDPVTPEEIAERLDWEQQAWQLAEGQHSNPIYTDLAYAGYVWPTLSVIRRVREGKASYPALLQHVPSLNTGKTKTYLGPTVLAYRHDSVPLRRMHHYPSLRGAHPRVPIAIWHQMDEIARGGLLNALAGAFQHGAYSARVPKPLWRPDDVIWNPPVPPQYPETQQGYAAYLGTRAARAGGFYYENLRRNLPRVWQELHKSLWETKKPNGS